MPTPIRVRGKRDNKRRAVGKRNRQPSPTLTDDGSMPKPLSSLERLPTELLQKIFLLSRNFDLPLASPILCATLNSEHVKKRFIFMAFAFAEVTYEAPEQPAVYNGDTDDEDMKLQSQLMSMKWFNLHFLKQCREEYVEQQFKSAVNFYERRFPAEAGNGLLEELKRFYNDIPDRDELGYGGMTKFARMPAAGSPAPAFSVLFWINKAPTFDTPSTFLIEMIHRSLYRPLSIQMPYLIFRASVPNRVLRGPWSKDKLDLLIWILEELPQCECEHDPDESDSEWHLEGCGCEYSLNLDYEVASQGLEDAIREHCIPAIALLAKARPLPWFQQHILSPLRYLPRPYRGDHSKYGIEVDTRLFNGGPLARVGVQVREAHLVAALQTAEKLGDPDVKVYSWLLPLAVIQQHEEPTIYATKKELFVLVEWAINKKVEEKRKGIVDGFGAKALKMLDEEQRDMIKNFKQVLERHAPRTPSLLGY